MTPLPEPIEGHSVSSCLEEELGWVLLCECNRRFERSSPAKVREAHNSHLYVLRARVELEGGEVAADS